MYQKVNKSNNKKYSEQITAIIKDYLKEYLKNIEFDMTYSNSNFVFEVKDVEVRNDLLKKFGIPLDLNNGKIQEIKVTIQSLTFDKPVLIDVTGINVELRTIYLTRDYKKDLKNFRQKILDEWERTHKEFLKNLNKKETFLERTLMNQIIPMKIEINNIKVIICDTITSEYHRNISLLINNITSYGCDQSWEPILQQKEDMDIHRIFKFSKIQVNMYNLQNEKIIKNSESDSNNSFIQPFDFLIKAAIPKKKNHDFRKYPKLNLEMSVESALIIEVSMSKLKFLISFLNYLSKIKKVEKYWVHRPDIKDEKINENSANEWFKYAFRVVREEVRNRKRKSDNFTSMIEKIMNMERYIQHYKTSHKLIIAPWIKYDDWSEDLKALENKMTIEDILYCREVAFTELITEGKAFCASGEVGKGYKPLVHLWEFYVNDLRSKWRNKLDTNKQIELSSTERRDLMKLANLDNDKVILSYLKGEPNHPEDIISSIKINFEIVIINFSRKVKSSLKSNINEKEMLEHFTLYHNIYNGILKKQLQNINFVKYFNSLNEDDIRDIIKSQVKTDNPNESHEEDNILNINDANDVNLNNPELILPNTNISSSKKKNIIFEENYYKKDSLKDTNFFTISEKFGETRTRKVEYTYLKNSREIESDSIDYLDEVDEVEEIIGHQNIREINLVQNQLHSATRKSFRVSQPKSLNKKVEFPFSVKYTTGEQTVLNDGKLYSESNNNKFNGSTRHRKTIISVVIGNSIIKQVSYRNNAENVNLKIHSLNIIDHNLTYCMAIKRNDNIISNNNDSSISSNELADIVRTIFKQYYSENELLTYENKNEFCFNQTTCLEYYFAKFLNELMILQKNRDILFMNQMPHEKKFINDFIYKFGFREVDINKEFSDIEDYYPKLVNFLVENEMLKDKLQIIEKVIKQLKLNYLLNDNYNIFNRHFISSVFEKGSHKHITRTKRYVHDSDMDRSESKESISMIDKYKESNMRLLMVKDMNFIMEEICVNLIKYVFSSMYPYFLHEKSVQSVFKTNMKFFLDKISEKNREENKKNNKIFYNVSNQFFLVMNMTKKGRDYPHYIYKHSDNFSEGKDPLKDKPAAVPEVGIYNKEEELKSSPNLNYPTESLILVKMDKDFNVEICNETLGELLSILPLISQKNVHEKLVYEGNILTDLKKSYLDIYEDLRQLKAKWKVMEYLKEFKKKRSNNNSDKTNYSSSEMNYLQSKLNHIEEIANEKTHWNLSSASFNLKVIDKIFFITFEKYSSLSFQMVKLDMSNSRMTKLPILDKDMVEENIVRNSKLFDFNLILKLLLETNIEIEKIKFIIDDSYPLLESNLKIKIISSIIPNIPFIPNEVIDMSSSFIKLNITPAIQKVNYIISNLNYYNNLFTKKFSVLSKEKLHTPNDYNQETNKSSIILHFHRKLNKNLLKIFENRDRFVDFISYLKNRNNSIFFYSIGKLKQPNSDYTDGIFIEFKDYNKKIKTENSFFNPHNDDSKVIPSEPSFFYKESNIITLHIPIIIMSKRNTIFYEEKQIWISDVSNLKVDKDPLEKLKINFHTDEKFHFTSFEYLFCKLFIDSTEFFKYNNEDIRSLKDVEFTSNEFPFDFKFFVPSKLKLNNLLKQKSFYYETEETLYKIYTKLFKNSAKQGISNIGKGSIMSYLEISIEKISFKISAKHNSQIIEYYKNLKNILVLENAMHNNKLYIPESLSNQTNANFQDSIDIKFKKIHTHKIIMLIKDIKFKAFLGTTNSHNNFMVIFAVNNINYQENYNLSLILKEKNLMNIENKLILSNFFISNIKIVFSIPHNFRKEQDEGKLKVIDPLKMEILFDHIRKEENKLIVFTIGNISLDLIEREHKELEFEVGDVIKIGFTKREGHKVDLNNIDTTQIEPIIWIVTNKLINSKTFNYSSFIDHKDLTQSKQIIFQPTDIERNKINDKLSGLELNSEFDYSMKFEFKLLNNSNKTTKDNDSSTLFYNFQTIMKIIKSLVSLNTEYRLNINLNAINIEIPWNIFHYIYFLRNYLRDIEAMIGKPNESLKIIDNKEYTKNVRFIENNNLNSNKRTLQVSQTQDNNTVKKDIKDKYYKIIQLFIPYLNISFKQKTSLNSEVIFFDFSIIKIKGDMIINLHDRLKDVLSIKVNNIKWKPFECRHTDLILKNENNQSDIMEIEIYLSNSKLEVKQGDKNGNPDDKIGIICKLKEITMIMINKSIKDIILFFEVNSECLKENFLIDSDKILDKIMPTELSVFKIYIYDATIILPESSQSANFILMKVADGSITFKESNQVPKLCIEPKNKFVYIDSKASFNLKTEMAQPQEIVPHSIIEIDANNVFSLLYIDCQTEEFLLANNLNIVIKSPKSDNVIMSLRNLKWIERYGTNVVTCKPSLGINLCNAMLKTSIGKLLAIKLFIEGNIDEKSSVLNEESSRFNNIDFEFNIDSGKVKVDVFKIPENFAKNIEHIVDKLPGNMSKINVDPLKSNISKD